MTRPSSVSDVPGMVGCRVAAVHRPGAWVAGSRRARMPRGMDGSALVSIIGAP